MFIENSDFDLNTFQLEISDHGCATLNGDWNCSDVCDPFSRLYYIKSGTGFLKYDKKTITLKPNNVYLVPAFLKFSYGCEYLEKIYFHVSIARTENYDLFSNINNILSLPFEEDEYEQLKKLYFSDNYLDKLTLKATIYKTLCSFINEYCFNKIPIKTYSQTVKKTLYYIHRHTKINLSVKTISKQLFISESKIRNSFKAELGITVGNYIDELVFIKAKKLLNKKQISIGEISAQLGFCDQFYFSRRFKEKYEITPSEYRKGIK